MAKKKTRKQLTGLNPFTGEMCYEYVADWGDVAELVAAGEVRKLRALFEQGMTFEEFDRDYCNAAEDRNYLHAAARAGNLALVELLVEQGADPDFWEDGTGETALGIAAANKDRPLLAYLVKVTRSEEDRKLGEKVLKRLGKLPK